MSYHGPDSLFYWHHFSAATGQHSYGATIFDTGTWRVGVPVRDQYGNAFAFTYEQPYGVDLTPYGWEDYRTWILNQHGGYEDSVYNNTVANVILSTPNVSNTLAIGGSLL